MADYTGRLSQWVLQTQERMDAVYRESVQRVIEDAQTPREQGGRMPVDTGFLRNTGKASRSGLPVGPSRQGELSGFESDIVLALGQVKAGEAIWWGWTANYASEQERKNGFMRGAAMKWPSIVNQVAREAQG